MSSGSRLSKQDIITYAAAGVALILALIVVLVKVGVFEKDEEGASTEAGSTVIVASETAENGDVVYYTMLEHYERPHVTTFQVYPTKKKTPVTEETTTDPVVEASRYVQVTNEDGIPLLNEWGEPVTQVEKYTVDRNEKTTGEKTTSGEKKTNVTEATEETTAVQQETQNTEAPAEENTGPAENNN